MARFLHDDLTDFRRVMDIDVLGVLLGSQRAARHMKAAGTGGSIVNVSSTAGLDAGAALVTYRAAKAAVIHASRSIALDLAGYGIRVNCLVPGGIRTPMTASAFDVDAVRALTQPLNREGLPEDVAEAALFLARDRSAQITGVTRPIDGGTTAGPPATQLKLLMSKAREA
jgi:NAD(P)-dependent dehydrogenase (short-subunit alcohol dehydrogenase family)